MRFELTFSKVVRGAPFYPDVGERVKRTVPAVSEQQAFMIAKSLAKKNNWKFEGKVRKLS